MAAETEQLLLVAKEAEKSIVRLVARQAYAGVLPATQTLLRCNSIESAITSLRAGAKIANCETLRETTAEQRAVAQEMAKAFAIINPLAYRGEIGSEDYYSKRETALVVSDDFGDFSHNPERLIITSRGKLLVARAWGYETRALETGEILSHGGKIPSVLDPENLENLKKMVLEAKRLFPAS